MSIYHGWVESQEQIDARTIRRALGNDARNLYLRSITEAEADRLHELIEMAEMADAHPVEVASHLDWLDQQATINEQRNSGFPF